nr:integrase, catalytic region, zinc finger, CCHC-type, peptidase aspartic, catalytic [Tanacetum cinerariifolium]
MAVTLVNNNKNIRFTEHIPSSGNTPIKITFSTNVVSNKPVFSFTRVNLLTNASGSQPQGNTKKDRIQKTQSRAKKNKLEDHPRIVRHRLHNKKNVVNTKSISSVPNSKLNVNSDLKCATCNRCLLSDNHDSCVLEFINSVNARVKSKSAKKPMNRKIWQPTGKMITTTAIVPLRKPIPIESNISKPVVTLVYSRKSKAAKKKVPVSNSKINKSLYLDSGCSKHMTRDRSQLINFVQKFLGTFKFGNDHVAKIMGYGDYKIGNVTIFRVYFVEGLGHNLFSADIGIFIGYAPTKKAFWIYNIRTRRIVETIHVDFDELTAMASEQSSSGPALNEMTPATISSGLVQTPSFQHHMYHLRETTGICCFNRLQAESTGSPSLTIVDQDAPSPSKSQTTQETQSSVLPQDVEEDIHDIEVAHMGNDPLFGVPISKVTSDQSLSTEPSYNHNSNEIAASNSNQEKEGPPQDSDIRKLIREECCIEVCEEQRQNMENTMLELVKICQQKELYCMHDNVDDLIESALNSKLLSINLNSQHLNKEKNEVKNVVEQPAERRTRIIESLQNFRVIHKSSTSLKNTSQISLVHAIVPILSTEEPEYSLSMGDDDAFEDIEYVEASLSDPEIVSLAEENDVYVEEEEVDLEDIFQIQDVILREKLLSINRLITNIESLNDNPTPDCVLINQMKETRSGSTTNHADNSFLEYDSFYFEIEPDQERLINVVKNDISDDSTNDPLLEEVDLFHASDNSIPPGIENIGYDLEGDIRFLEELFIDDSIPFLDNEASDFDNPSFPRPPPEPPDAEFDFETDSGEGDIRFLEELFIDDSIPFLDNEASDFDNPSFPRPPPEPPDAEFDFETDSGEGKDYDKIIKNQSKSGNIGHKIGSLHQKPDQRAFFYNNQAIKPKMSKDSKFKSSDSLDFEVLIIGYEHVVMNCGSAGIRRSNRRHIPNIVEPEIRTIKEILSMVDRTIEELLKAPTEGYGEAIVIPEILAENFEIKTNLLQLVQANKFHCRENDNPHTHISNFKRMTVTLKYRDVSNDAIKLMLFPYSLEDKARICNETTGNRHPEDFSLSTLCTELEIPSFHPSDA